MRIRTAREVPPPRASESIVSTSSERPTGQTSVSGAELPFPAVDHDQIGRIFNVVEQPAEYRSVTSAIIAKSS